MKTFVLFAVFLILFVDLSLQIPKLVNCSHCYVPPDSIANSCGLFTCDGPDKITGVGCPLSDCAAGKYLGTTVPDNSKVYPDCCTEPICEPF